MPACLMAGNSTGVRIMMVGVTSMEVPTSSTSRQMTSIRTVGCAMKGVRMLVTMAGMLATVMTQEDTMAAAARNMMTEEDFAAEIRQSSTSRGFSSR